MYIQRLMYLQYSINIILNPIHALRSAFARDIAGFLKPIPLKYEV